MTHAHGISAGIFVGFVLSGILGCDWRFIGGYIIGFIVTHILHKIIEWKFK